MRLSLLIVTAAAHLASGANNGISLRGINVPEEVPNVGEGATSNTDWWSKKPGTWPCWTWGCPSGKRCEVDGKCYNKMGTCQKCNEHSDCHSNYCNWKFQCSRKGQGFDNGCTCAFDRDCKSGRCSQGFKCIDKSGFGGSCSVASTTNDCKSGLSCGGVGSVLFGKCYHAPRWNGEPCKLDGDCKSGRCSQGFKCIEKSDVGESCNSLATTSNDCKDGLSCALPMGKCYHEPREAGEPCNPVKNNCANDAFCFPYVDQQGVSMGFHCAAANQCLLNAMAVLIKDVEPKFEDLKSLWKGESAKGFKDEASLHKFAQGPEVHKVLDAIDTNFLASKASSIRDLATKCGFEPEQESFGLSEELYGPPPSRHSSGLVLSTGIEGDAGVLVVKASVQLGIAASLSGVRPFYSYCGFLGLGAEASIGGFMTLQLGGGLDSKVGKSKAFIGVDVAPTVGGFDGGISFGATTDDKWKLNSGSVFDVTVNGSVGVGIAVELSGACQTYWL